MAKPELILSITELNKKIDMLLARQQKLSERVNELENDNRQLSIQHLKDMEHIDKLNKEIEFLSLSHRLANTPEALVSARAKISGLIRTIDSCIRLIKED